MNATWVVLTAALTAADAGRPPPGSVAVLAFRDLSQPNGRPGLGEGIRETVTLDLKESSTLRVVERAEIDRVLGEQRLAGSESDEPAAVAHAGRLIGADVLVLGAFQRVDRTHVRLTARFVRTETAEIIGTAKVDGVEADLLKLQDRIASELMRSAGLPARSSGRREWPQLPSLEVVDTFGQASVASSDPLRKALLAEVVKAAPTYPFAASELAALEARLDELAAKAQKANLELVDRLQGQLKATDNVGQRFSMRFQIINALRRLRRHHGIIKVYDDEIADLRGHLDEPMAETWLDSALVNRLLVLDELHLTDRLLRDAESFLATRPTSTLHPTVRSTVDRAIAQRKSIDEGAAMLAASRQRQPAGAPFDPCTWGRQAANWQQAKEAQEWLEQCLERTQGPPRQGVIIDLIDVALHAGNWALAELKATHLQREFPLAFEKRRASFEATVPVDE